MIVDCITFAPNVFFENASAFSDYRELFFLIGTLIAFTHGIMNFIRHCKKRSLPCSRGRKKEKNTRNGIHGGERILVIKPWSGVSYWQ